MNIFLNLIIILFSYSCKIIQSKPMISSNNSAKTQISSHLFLKQFFQITNEQMIQSGLDPNADMSKFNPLNLNANQTSQLQTLNLGTCYKDSYTRGAGSGVSYCNQTSEDKDNSLCYSKCKDGYNDIGLTCWKNCPDGWTDNGDTCKKDNEIIKT